MAIPIGGSGNVVLAKALCMAIAERFVGDEQFQSEIMAELKCDSIIKKEKQT